MEVHELTNGLLKIYLKDESEQANTEAISVISKAFVSDMGVLFYINAKNMYKFCLSGAGFPISIPEERWNQCVAIHGDDNTVHKFTQWDPPGIDIPVEHWMSIKLNIAENKSSYVFLGRKNLPWSVDDIAIFSSIAQSISEVISLRYGRDIEIKNRLDMEDTLKLTQTRMSTFFNASHDAIYTTNMENCFTSVNSSALMLFGVQNENQLLGRCFADFTPEYHGSRPFGDHEIVLKRDDGTLIYCLESVHPVTRSDGAIIEIQGMIKDISDRIKNEKELVAMNLEMKKINLELKKTQELMIQQQKLAAIGKIAGGIAHEINNPLAFITTNQSTLRSYIKTLSDVFQQLLHTDEKAEGLYEKKDLAYIFSEAENIFIENDTGFTRIKEIISHLLSFSRTKSTEECELYNVNEGIENTLIIASSDLLEGVEVTKKLEKIPDIYAQKDEINQVFLNILINASQAIASQKRPEKGHIHIETLSENGTVIIRIKDDGPGISKENCSLIFDPFFTTKEPGKGTGLGLSISYDIIVSKQGGTLSVESEEGKGACFTITLPIKKVNYCKRQRPFLPN